MISTASVVGNGAVAVLYALSNTIWPTGALNPAVTKDNISKTICVSGWTATVRPPQAYTDALKLKQMKDRGLAEHPGLYEEDHFIPLCLGGNPTDPNNLWPQPWPQAHQKDEVEVWLKNDVCAGKMSLDAAREAIRTDWTAVYKRIHSGIAIK